MAQRVGFFGPFGTFTEQALKTLADLAGSEHVPYRTVPDVLDAVEAGEVDFGLVPIENSIEGMVNFTQDALAFDHELLIVREVVIDIEHCLLARPGVALGRREARAFDPGRHGAVPPLPAREPPRGRDASQRTARPKQLAPSLPMLVRAPRSHRGSPATCTASM